MNTLEYKFGSGDIHTISRGAVDFARTHVKRDGKAIEFLFTFNQIEVSGNSSSSPQDLVEKYYLAHTIRRLKAGYKD
jgi:hypothetical protein